MKAYTLSGDNYPHRIPKYNDAERLHVFRESAIRGMVKDGTFTKKDSTLSMKDRLQEWMQIRS